MLSHTAGLGAAVLHLTFLEPPNVNKAHIARRRSHGRSFHLANLAFKRGMRHDPIELPSQSFSGFRDEGLSSYTLKEACP